MPHPARNIIRLQPSVLNEGQTIDDRTLVTARELANFLNLEERRIHQLCEVGMPRRSRGKYPLKVAVNWYLKYKEQSADRRIKGYDDRKHLAQALLAEYRYKAAKGEHLPKGKLNSILASEFSQVREDISRLCFGLGQEVGLPREVLLGLRAAIYRESREYFDSCRRRITRS